MHKLSLRIALAVLILLCGSAVWVGISLYRERVAQLEQEVEGTRKELAAVDQALQSERDRVRDVHSQAQEAAATAAREQNLRSQAEQEAREAEERRAQALTEAETAKRGAQLAREAAARAEQDLKTVIEARQAELDRMQQALSRIVETRRTPQGMVVVLTDAHFKFAFDKAELSAQNRELLSRVAGVLLASSGYRLNIDGHTDDVGPAAYNQLLSERRAQAVADYLVDAGLPRELIAVRGYGEQQPKRTGSSPEARAENRRVEIGITDTVITYHGVASNG
jgi:outer membrane protein OmpA-like peptidoglycan-associated protein